MHRWFLPARAWAAVSVGLLALAGFSGASSGAQDGSGLLRLPGHVPDARFAARVAGEVAPGEPIPLAVTLPLRHPRELQTLLLRLYDPRDPLYGHFLSPDEFRDRFAPTAAQYQSVAAFARSRGLAVTGTHPNRLILDVEGPAAVVERAFSTRLRQFQAAAGRIFRAPVVEPGIPAALAGTIEGVVGLDDLAHLRPHRLRRRADLSPQALPRETGSGPGGGLTPSDLRTAYDLAGTALNGSGQTLAVFELDGYDPADVTAYEDFFGLPHVPLQNVRVDGFSGAAGSGADEVTLDIELQAALAPGAAKILVYEGPNSNVGVLDTYNKIATAGTAQSISTSWGLPELEMSASARGSENSIFQQMASQGQSMFAASGDSGAYDDGSTLSVDDPASQPYVTGVGGTFLTTSGPGGPWSSETSWNGGTAARGGGGGGISAVWSIPSYQKGSISTASKGSMTMRNVPDVALAADPNSGYSIYVGGEWWIFGGTSCASPLWASFTALANQSRAASSLGPAGFLNPLLYPIGQGARRALDFHDLADGSTNLFYPTASGYDCATGWGTLDGANLLVDLTAGGAVASPPSISNVQVSPTALAASGGVVTASAQVTASATLSSVQVTVTPPSGTATTTALARVGTTNTYRGTLNLPANSGATDAVYRLAVGAVDVNGATASSDAGTVTVISQDTAPPAITGAQVSPSSLTAAGGSVAISATVTDNTAVGSVAATVTAPDGGSSVVTLARGQGNTYGGSFLAAANTTTTAQTYRVSVTARDTSSNTAVADAGSFTVAAAPVPDTTPPSLKGGSLTPRTLPARGGTVTIQVTATDNVAVASVVATVRRPNKTTVTVSLTPAGGSVWSGTYAAAANTAHSPKTFSVSARATDTSNNTSTSLSVGGFTVKGK